MTIASTIFDELNRKSARVINFDKELTKLTREDFLMLISEAIEDRLQDEREWVKEYVADRLERS